jgi:amino acid adenylation domain-containing protein
MMRANYLLHDLLADTAAQLPDKIAVICGDATITYRELAERAYGLAGVFAARGVERGDRVAIFADNSIDTCVAFWAALAANAVAVVIHPQTKPAKLAYVLRDAAARVVVSESRLAPLIPEEFAVIVDDATRASTPPPRNCLDIDLAALIYTSGSTGEPKGVMLSHRNMLAANASISQYLEIRQDDIILCALPLAFDYGLYQTIMAVARGARVVLEKSFAFPTEVLRTCVRHRVTGLPGVPTMFATLLGMASLGSYDLSAIRYVTNTAAALPKKHVLALKDSFPRAKVFSMYGLTECKRCTYLPPEDLARKPESVGIAIPNTELWLVDEHDRKLPPGQVGQLVIRGATVMQGYWNKPEATGKKLRPGPLPGERVLYTGDLCRLDEDGYLYFVARMDDVIKSRGEKVAPKEVESALLDIPGVREAAVIGVPDELLGQAIHAYVVLDPVCTLDARALQRECRQRLESFMVPTEIIVRDSLPRSGNGKIHKAALAQREDGASGLSAEPEKGNQHP